MWSARGPERWRNAQERQNYGKHATRFDLFFSEPLLLQLLHRYRSRSRSRSPTALMRNGHVGLVRLGTVLVYSDGVPVYCTVIDVPRSVL
jgi:hypothetical protein